MESLFLTDSELTELTGFKTPAGHVKWLEKNRWRYVLTRSKQARVSVDYFHQKMGSTGRKTGSPDELNHATTLVEPDFSAIDRL